MLTTAILKPGSRMVVSCKFHGCNGGITACVTFSELVISIRGPGMQTTFDEMVYPSRYVLGILTPHALSCARC